MVDQIDGLENGTANCFVHIPANLSVIFSQMQITSFDVSSQIIHTLQGVRRKFSREAVYPLPSLSLHSVIFPLPR